MKRFEVGKEYAVPGHGTIKIEKRTKCYITFSGCYTGRKKLEALFKNGLFGLGENIWICDSQDHINVLVCAGYKK